MPSNLYESFDEAAKAGNGSHIWKVESPDGACFCTQNSARKKAAGSDGIPQRSVVLLRVSWSYQAWQPII